MACLLKTIKRFTKKRKKKQRKKEIVVATYLHGAENWPEECISHR